MKITKRQIRQLVREQTIIPGLNPDDFMDEVTEIYEKIVSLRRGTPFRSAAVRTAIQKVHDGIIELQDSMTNELAVRHMWDD